MFSLLLCKKGDVEDVEKKEILPILFHTVFYISLFCSITIGFGLLKLLEDYSHLTGRVIEFESDSPVKHPSILLTDTEDIMRSQIEGDEEGYCETLLKQETCESIENWKLVITAKGYDPLRIPILDCINLSARWRKIRLRKQRN